MVSDTANSLGARQLSWTGGIANVQGADAVDPVVGGDRAAVGDPAPERVDDRRHVRQRHAEEREFGNTKRVPQPDAVRPRGPLLITGNALDRPSDPPDLAGDDP